MEGAKAIAEQKVIDLQRAQTQATVLFEEEAALRQKIGGSLSLLLFLLVLLPMSCRQRNISHQSTRSFNPILYQMFDCMQTKPRSKIFVSNWK